MDTDSNECLRKNQNSLKSFPILFHIQANLSTHIFMFHFMKDSHFIPIIVKVFSWCVNFDKKYLETFQKYKTNIHKFLFYVIIL